MLASGTVGRVPTLVDSFEPGGRDAVVRLQVEPHLVTHAHDEVRDAGPGQSAQKRKVRAVTGVTKHLYFYLEEDHHVFLPQQTSMVRAFRPSFEESIATCNLYFYVNSTLTDFLY